MRLNFRNISPVNLILTPIKQHIGCCVVAPLMIKLAGASVLAEMIVKNERAEFIFLLLVLPPVVWAVVKGEDAWRAHHEKKHLEHGEHCDDHCHVERGNFKKRYALNLAIAFTVAFLFHHFFHHHHT